MKYIMMIIAFILLTACTSPTVKADDAVELVRNGQLEAAVHSLEESYQKEQNEEILYLQQRVKLYIQAKQELDKGNLEVASLLLTDIRDDNNDHPLIIHLQQDAKELQKQLASLAKTKAQLESSLVEVRVQIRNKEYGQAKEVIKEVLAESKSHPSFRFIHKEAKKLEKQL